MLLSTVNNSIGNKKNHLTINDLCNLFNKKDAYTNLDKYVIDTIQTEATQKEIYNLKTLYNISNKDIQHLLSINPY